MEALILKRYPVGEHDCICSMFSPDHGKIRAAARHAMKPRSRFSGLLEPFNVLDAEIQFRENRDLHRMTEARLMRRFSHLIDTLEKVSAAFEIIEVLERFTPDSEPAPDLYAAAITALACLEANSSHDELILRFFEYAYLVQNGYALRVDACIRCGKARGQKPARIHIEEGGAICSQCRQDPAVPVVSHATLECMQRLRDRRSIPILDAGVQEIIRHEMRTIVLHIFEFHLGMAPLTWQKNATGLNRSGD